MKSDQPTDKQVDQSADFTSVNKDIPKDEEFIKHLITLETKLLSMGFKELGRDIHHPEALRFNREVLHSPPEVMDVLLNGYVPDYVARPPPEHLENNRSASENMGFCIQQVTIIKNFSNYYTF